MSSFRFFVVRIESPSQWSTCILDLTYVQALGELYRLFDVQYYLSNFEVDIRSLWDACSSCVMQKAMINDEIS